MSKLNRFQVVTKTSVSFERIADLLCCAFEGGSNYWYNIVDYRTPPYIWSRNSEGGQIYKYMQFPLSEGGGILIEPMERDEQQIKPQWLDLESIERGLDIMATHYPKDFRDFVNDNEDATTGDIFLQCCLYGEVIFG